MGWLVVTAALLARAEAAGLTLEAQGDRLRLVAAAPPPLALLHDLAGAKAELLDLLAERAAIQAEPPLPPLGTPDRDRLENAHRATVAGLLAVARTDWTHEKRKARHG